MPFGTVTKYDTMESTLMGHASRQWDDSTAGSCMFILADNTYVIDTTDVTAADLTGVITAGDGAPINVGSPALDSATTAGTTYIDSSSADFGAIVTITAKFLICIQPITAAIYATTASLLWVVDLDTTSSSTSKTTTTSSFAINTPANGWLAST